MRFSLFLEGVLERESTEISFAVIKSIKRDIEILATEGGLIYFYGDRKSVRDLPSNNFRNLELPNLKFPNIIILIKSDLSTLNVSGSFLFERNLLRINIHIPTAGSQFPYNLSKLLPLLKKTIRHELEHSTQSELSLRQAAMTDSDNINYWIDPAEVAAYVVSLYKKAKGSKRPLTDVMFEYLKHVERHFISKGMSKSEAKEAVEKIHTAWDEYRLKRFPKSF